MITPYMCKGINNRQYLMSQIRCQWVQREEHKYHNTVPLCNSTDYLGDFWLMIWNTRHELHTRLPFPGCQNMSQPKYPIEGIILWCINNYLIALPFSKTSTSFSYNGLLKPT
jgi:hypothetical protein